MGKWLNLVLTRPTMAADDVPPTPTATAVFSPTLPEQNDLTTKVPCPSCGGDLDAFGCCWRCHGRLCQSCGAWMRGQPYAVGCAECLEARFGRLAAERQRTAGPADQVDNPRLHLCPACAAQGLQKWIPSLW